jgi:hypothetical protein
MYFHVRGHYIIVDWDHDGILVAGHFPKLMVHPLSFVLYQGQLQYIHASFKALEKANKVCRMHH